MQAGMMIQITCIDNGFLVACPGNRQDRPGTAHYFETLVEATNFINKEHGEFKPKISE